MSILHRLPNLIFYNMDLLVKKIPRNFKLPKKFLFIVLKMLPTTTSTAQTTISTSPLIQHVIAVVTSQPVVQVK